MKIYIYKDGCKWCVSACIKILLWKFIYKSVQGTVLFKFKPKLCGYMGSDPGINNNKGINSKYPNLTLLNGTTTLVIPYLPGLLLLEYQGKNPTSQVLKIEIFY
jgi:hypothetical protein